MNGIMIYLVLINLFTFLLYGLDKWYARTHRYRISERMLLLLALFGGSAGALLGMYGFRHKTKHLQFVILVPMMLLLHVLILMKFLFG